MWSADWFLTGVLYTPYPCEGDRNVLFFLLNPICQTVYSFVGKEKYQKLCFNNTYILSLVWTLNNISNCVSIWDQHAKYHSLPMGHKQQAHRLGWSHCHSQRPNDHSSAPDSAPAGLYCEFSETNLSHFLCHKSNAFSFSCGDRELYLMEFMASSLSVPMWEFIPPKPTNAS